MKLNPLVAAFLICCSFGCLDASTLVTPERGGINQVGIGMSIYSQTHNGESPGNWSEIGQAIDLKRLDGILAKRGVAPLEERYQFVTQPLPTLDDNADVLLIRCIPIERTRKEDQYDGKNEQWRYMVTRDRTGVISATRIPESEVQAMLHKANVTIAPRPDLPKADKEESLSSILIGPQIYNRHLAMYIIVGAILLVIVGLSAWRKLS